MTAVIERTSCLFVCLFSGCCLFLYFAHIAVDNIISMLIWRVLIGIFGLWARLKKKQMRKRKIRVGGEGGERDGPVRCIHGKSERRKG